MLFHLQQREMIKYNFFSQVHFAPMKVSLIISIHYNIAYGSTIFVVKDYNSFYSMFLNSQINLIKNKCSLVSICK